MADMVPTVQVSNDGLQNDAHAGRIARPMELACVLALFVVVALLLHHEGFRSPFLYDSTFLSDNINAFARHDLSQVLRIVPERSFTLLAFYVNYLMAGMNPYWFRLVNALIMASAGLALVLMYQVVFSVPGLSVPGSGRDKIRVAWFLGLLFVVHPLQCLVVLYVWQRTAIMACLFYFSSVAVYVAIRSGRFPKSGPPYVLISVLVAAGTLCKENVLTVPAVLLAAEATLFRQTFANLIKKAVFLALLTLPALLTYLVVAHTLHQSTSLEPRGVLERLHQHYQLSGLTPVEVIMTESRVFFSYMLMILAPFVEKVELIRAETISRSLLSPPSTIFACAGLIGLSVLGMWRVHRERLMAFGILFTLIVLAPELVLSPQYLFFGHRAILPMAGVLLLLGQAILIAISRVRVKVPNRIPALVSLLAGLVIVVSLAALSRSYAKTWNPFDFWQNSYRGLPVFSKDIQKRPYLHILSNYGIELMKARRYPEAIDLFEKALDIQPDSYEIYGNLGSAWLAQGRADKAVKYYRRAIELKPDSGKAHLELGDALAKSGKYSVATKQYKRARLLMPGSAEPYIHLANLLHRSGKSLEAMSAYAKAIELNPASVQAHTRLGNLLIGRGKVQEALNHYREAVRAGPDSALAYNNVGAALLRINRFAEAKENFERALALHPRFAAAYANLGIVSLALGKPEEAIRHLKKSLELDNKNATAHVYLGHAYRSTGKTRQAVRQYAKALDIEPNLVQAHYYLGNALAALGDLDSAKDHYNRVLQVNPRHYMAHNALGVALASTGKLAEAVRHFRKALDLEPGFADARKNLNKALLRQKNGEEDRKPR